MGNLGWIFVHGIGANDCNGYANKFMSEIYKSRDHDICIEVNWQKFLEPSERNLFSNCGSNLGFKWIRKLITSYASDVLVYRSRSGFYKKIHKHLSDQIEILKDNNVDGIVFVGHSLGSFIIANFLWDAVDMSFGGSDIFSLSEDNLDWMISKLHTVAYVSSPISVWTAAPDSGNNIDYQKFINLKSVLNIYSKYDIISWPQNCINDSFKIVTDININYGSLLTRYTPASHIKAWDDDRVIGCVLSKIET